MINTYCRKAPKHWYCTRFTAHTGPCAAKPRWYNLSKFARAGKR